MIPENYPHLCALYSSIFSEFFGIQKFAHGIGTNSSELIFVISALFTPNPRNARNLGNTIYICALLFWGASLEILFRILI